MPAEAITCRNLVKAYNDIVAVAGLDLTVHRGECFGLLGPNGAGKTTTIEILEGLNQQDSGEVTVLGLSWQDRKQARALRERLGIQLQETQLADKLTVEEAVRLFRSFYPKSYTVEEAMQRVGITQKKNTWVSRLSGGEKQRLALACALVSKPDLLFLDEPTTGLDPNSRRQLWDLVHEFRGQGGTVLLTTHYMDEAEKLCDRLSIIDHGKEIAQGTPHALVASLGGEHVLEFSTQSTAAHERSLPAFQISEGELRALPGVTAVRFSNDKTALAVAEIHVVLPALLNCLQTKNLQLAHLTTHHATLEDVFVALTGRNLQEGTH